MSEIIEKYTSGFCKAQNQTEQIIVEFSDTGGKLTFLRSSCSYGKCKFWESCETMKRALEDE